MTLLQVDVAHAPDPIEPVRRAFATLRPAREAMDQVIGVTSQSGIGRDYNEDDDLDRFLARIFDRRRSEGATLE